MSTATPATQLDSFLDRYTPAIAALARAILDKMRARVPGAVELVYDNYNALVIGFSPTDRASDAVFSVALYPRWVNLFFLHGAALDDPEGLLQGSGSQVRSIRVSEPALLDSPTVKRLLKAALRQSETPFGKKGPRRMVIKAVSGKQRPRRPAASG